MCVCARMFVYVCIYDRTYVRMYVCVYVCIYANFIIVVKIDSSPPVSFYQHFEWASKSICLLAQKVY